MVYILLKLAIIWSRENISDLRRFVNILFDIAKESEYMLFDIAKYFDIVKYKDIVMAPNIL